MECGGPFAFRGRRALDPVPRRCACRPVCGHASRGPRAARIMSSRGRLLADRAGHARAVVRAVRNRGGGTVVAAAAQHARAARDALDPRRRRSGRPRQHLPGRALPARRAVLKLTPSPKLAAAEAHALTAWACSRRVPAVWGHDPAAGALLLEAIDTETPLADQPTPASTGAIGALIADLHHAGRPPAPGVIEPLSARVAFMFAHGAERHRGDPVARAAVARARIERGHDLARTLAADPVPGVLVHGDLHAAKRPRRRPGPRAGRHRPPPVHRRRRLRRDRLGLLPRPECRRLAARADQLATVLDTTRERIWQWCVATAPLLAAGKAARGATAEEIQALLALAP